MIFTVDWRKANRVTDPRCRLLCQTCGGSSKSFSKLSSIADTFLSRPEIHRHEFAPPQAIVVVGDSRDLARAWVNLIPNLCVPPPAFRKP